MKYLESFKLFESVAQAKSILKSLNLTQDDTVFKQIRQLLKGHDGYIGWFTKLHYIQKYSWNNLQELWDYINDNKPYITKIGNITGYDNIEKLQDDVEAIKVKTKLSQTINEFPQKQKAFLRDADNVLLTSLSQRRDNKAFFRKIASYHNRTTLLTALKNFLKTDPSATMYSVIKKAKANGSEIIHASYEDQLLIIRVFTVDELNSVAGDCSWCIRSAGTFNNYAGGNNKQFIMFFFDKIGNDSRIGATWTLNNGGRSNFLYTAHNKIDASISYDKLKEQLAEYNFDIKELNYKLSDIDINAASVKQLIEIFDLSKEKIVQLKPSFKGSDLSFFTEEEIEKWGLLDKSEIDVNSINKYRWEYIKEKNLLHRVNTLFISTLVSLTAKWGTQVIEYLKSNPVIFNKLSNDSGFRRSSDRGFFNKLVNEAAPTRFYDLAVGSKWSDRDYYDSTSSAFKAFWFYKEMKILYDKLDDKSNGIKDIFQALEKSNYSISFIMEVLGASAEEVLTASNDSYTFRILIDYLTKHSLPKEKVVNQFFNLVINYRIDSRDMAEYKKTFSEEQYKQLEEKVFKQEFTKAIDNMKPYDRESNSIHAKAFYDKYHKYLKDYDPPLPRDGAANLILAYCRIKKLDELDNMILTKDTAGTINAIICDEYKTNGGIREPLTSEQKKSLYNWLKNQNIDNTSKYSKNDETHEFNDGDPRQNYVTSMYLYDKKEFKKYMEFASKEKMNYRYDNGYSMTGKLPDKTDKKMFTTMRPSLLKPPQWVWHGVDIFIMLHDKPDEIIKLIKEMLSWKLYTPELTYIFNWLSSLRRIKRQKEIMQLLLDELIDRKGSTATIVKWKKAIEETYQDLYEKLENINYEKNT